MGVLDHQVVVRFGPISFGRAGHGFWLVVVRYGLVRLGLDRWDRTAVAVSCCLFFVHPASGRVKVELEHTTPPPHPAVSCGSVTRLHSTPVMLAPHRSWCCFAVPLVMLLLTGGSGGAHSEGGAEAVPTTMDEVRAELLRAGDSAPLTREEAVAFLVLPVFCSSATPLSTVPLAVHYSI